MPTRDSGIPCPNDEHHETLDKVEQVSDEEPIYICHFCPSGENRWTWDELQEALQTDN